MNWYKEAARSTDYLKNYEIPKDNKWGVQLYNFIKSQNVKFPFYRGIQQSTYDEILKTGYMVGTTKHTLKGQMVFYATSINTAAGYALGGEKITWKGEGGAIVLEITIPLYMVREIIRPILTGEQPIYIELGRILTKYRGKPITTDIIDEIVDMLSKQSIIPNIEYTTTNLVPAKYITKVYNPKTDFPQNMREDLTNIEDMREVLSRFEMKGDRYFYENPKKMNVNFEQIRKSIEQMPIGEKYKQEARNTVDKYANLIEGNVFNENYIQAWIDKIDKYPPQYLEMPSELRKNKDINLRLYSEVIPYIIKEVTEHPSMFYMYYSDRNTPPEITNNPKIQKLVNEIVVPFYLKEIKEYNMTEIDTSIPYQLHNNPQILQALKQNQTAQKSDQKVAKSMSWYKTAQQYNPKLPDWINEEMVSTNKDPMRMLNDIDFERPETQDALRNEPLLQYLQKHDPKMAEKLLSGNMTRKEYLNAIIGMENNELV